LKGIASPRGPDRLPSDCSQSEPLSCSPTGLNARGPSDFSVPTRGFADSSDSSVHLEGRTEHSDEMLPMVFRHSNKIRAFLHKVQTCNLLVRHPRQEKKLFKCRPDV
jgi:hypothetical protein